MYVKGFKAGFQPYMLSICQKMVELKRELMLDLEKLFKAEG